jgi:hypothetical protein
MHSPIVVATSVAMVEGQGWGPHNTSITNANTEQALIAALTTLHSQLLSGQTFANENAVKTCCMNKYSAVGGSTGGIWTRSVAQWYLRCMNTFAVPVVPTVAYPGQYFPPAYLFTPPPSALIPVVPVPQPTMVVANAVPIPVHNDAAWATATPVAVVATRYDNDGVPVANAVAMSIPIVPTVGGKSNSAASAVPTPTPNPTNNGGGGGSGGSGGSGGAVWVDFDKNVTTEPQKIEQVPFVYTPPSNGSACWVNDDKIPISVEQVQEAVPIVQPRVVPKPEATLDYKDGDETTTDVWCTPEEQFDTTHINLWNNDITKFEGLHKFPNLLRLTVRSNEITNLQGVSSAKNLRWLDVSDNDVNSLNGLEGMSSLEWLDVHNNEFTSLAGMGLLPQLTFLNMRHSDLKHLKGTRNPCSGLSICVVCGCVLLRVAKCSTMFDTHTCFNLFFLLFFFFLLCLSFRHWYNVTTNQIHRCFFQ